MANGNDEQTDAPALGNIQNPKTVEPDTSLNPDTTNIDRIRDSIPQFKGLNSYYLKKQLLEDDDTFEQTARTIFTQGVGFENIRDGDPEEIANAYEGFKKNFRKDLVDSSYSGEDIDDTLINRSMELADDPTKINSSDYANVIKSNSKKYKSKGLIDKDGQFLYEGDDTAFAQHVLSNSELHKELQRDRYKAFESELGKYHNQVDGLDDPALRTKAWVIYDKKGPEGLTQFVNKIQDETINDQFNENSYFRKAKVGDTNLSDYYNEFVNGNVKDVPYGREIAEASYKNEIDPALMTALIRQESNFDPNAESSKGAVGLGQLMPDTARVDLGINPDDRTDPVTSINGSAQYLRRLLDKYKGDERKALAGYNAGMGNVDKAIKRAKEEGGEWEDYLPKREETIPYMSNIAKYRAEYQDKTDGGLVFRPRKPKEDITEDVPKDLNGYTVSDYKRNGNLKSFDKAVDGYIKEKIPKAISKQFKKERLTKEGTHSDEYRDIVTSIYKDAVNEGKFSTNDLLNTLFANADYKAKDAQGDEFYELNYNNLQWSQKLAFDALQLNPEIPAMVKDQGDGVYRIFPDIQTKALRGYREARAPFYMTETEVSRDKDGNIQFNEVPAKGAFAQASNALVNLVFGGAKFANDYGLKPIFAGLEKLTGGEYDWITEMKDATEANTSITLSELSSADEDGWLPNATEEVAPMFWYMASMFAGGGAITKGVGKGLQLISRGKASADMSRMGALLNGSSKWNKIGKGIQQSSNPAMKLYAGGAGLEALTPKKDSFYNIIPQLFGEKQDNSVRQFYNTADWWTRKAMDVGGSLMLDFGIDTFIGASRFTKDVFAKKFFDRKEFKSFDAVRKVDKDGNMTIQYEMVDSPQFRHEISRFYNEIANGLAEKPLGSIGEAMGKDLSDEAGLKTLHDFVKKYTDSTSDVANNLRGEIKEHIQTLQKKFGNGAKLEGKDLDRLVDSQYGRFMETSGDNLYKMLKESDDAQLPLRFAQVLDEQLPVMKEAEVAGRKIRPNEASYWREEKGMNLVVKGNKVYEVDSKFWASDLADVIRKKHLKASPETVANRKIKQAGIDPANPKDRAGEMADIKAEARQIVGTPTVVDGKLGYVTNYSKKGYDVVTSDGIKFTPIEDVKKGIKSPLRSDLTSGQLVKRMGDYAERVSRGEGRGFSQQRFDMLRRPQSSLEMNRPTQKLLPAPRQTGVLTLEGAGSMARQAEQYGGQMLSTLERSERRLLPAGGSVERQHVEEVLRTRDQIRNLEDNYSRLDEFYPDDGKKRGQLKRDLTRRIKDLKAQREQAEERLANFYKNNPDVQKERVQQIVGENATMRVEERMPRAQREAGVEDPRILSEASNKVGDKITVWSKHPNTGKKIKNQRVLRRDEAGFYTELRGNKHYLNIKSAGNEPPSSASLIFETSEFVGKGETLMRGAGELAGSGKVLRKKLDDFAQKMHDLAKTETKIPFC